MTLQLTDILALSLLPQTPQGVSGTISKTWQNEATFQRPDLAFFVPFL